MNLPPAVDEANCVSPLFLSPEQPGTLAAGPSMSNGPAVFLRV